METVDTTAPALKIRPFRRADQEAAATLIRANLAARFGRLDPTRNPDLVDIAAAYREDHFLVAFVGDRLAGTGALRTAGTGVGRIERMHTDAAFRRRGVATRMLAALQTLAESRGFESIVLETTIGWTDAERFYRAAGFRESHRLNGEVHFSKHLER